MDCSAATDHRARMAHECHLCGEDIRPGTVYRRWCCWYEGTVAAVTVHVLCYAEACDRGLMDGEEWTVQYPLREDLQDARDDGQAWEAHLAALDALGGTP